ncbi:MFS transporter [Candidatus Saganbacteria bacterium]|uniref:MFS transporter n=1 Tax=Candidatus Saganbacteria bacterium TaxID=2575572 RepID=A0A9D6UMB5_UNCSA|nr:MFS transporter [Candidatus Saganbacteria bacterium]
MIKKLAYSLGAVATALSYQAFSAYIIFFYVDMMKLPMRLAGVGMIIYGIWNAVNDPIAGFISDRTRTRWGRRIPYIVAGAIPFGVTYFLLWTPPFRGGTHAVPLFWYFVAMLCLFDGFYTFTVLNWASLFPEMFPGLRERAEVNSYRQSFGMLGLLMGVALPPLIYSRWGWQWMGAGFGCAIAFFLLIAAWGSRERKEFSLDRPLSLFLAAKATLSSRSFLTFVFANLFVQYTFTIILATIPFFAKYVLNTTPAQTTLILAAAFLTAIPMLYVWRSLAVRFGAKYCFMASMVVLALFLVPLFFVKSFGPVLLTSALIGIGLSGFILLSDIIISDVIDEDELITGTRREGMFFGTNAFITRFAIGMEVLSMTAVFASTGYNHYIFTQPREFQFGIRLLLAGFPTIALILGFGIMLWYPLAGKKFEAVKRELSEVHAKKGVI